METWRIDELAERAAAALVGTDAPAASGRVTPVPDRRMLRYYTTLGLLDRPEVRGRVAYYGRRHLLQAWNVAAELAHRQALDGERGKEIAEPVGRLHLPAEGAHEQPAVTAA